MNAPKASQSGLEKDPGKSPPADAGQAPKPAQVPELPPEYGGRKSGLEPTRYGDWEKDGRCIDF